jgi:hypothetical protein
MIVLELNAVYSFKNEICECDRERSLLGDV